MYLRHLVWLSIFILVGAIAASEVPFIFDENSSYIADNSQAKLEKGSELSRDSTGGPPLPGLLYKESVRDILGISRSIESSIHNNSNISCYILSSFATIDPRSIDNTSIMINHTELPPDYSMPEASPQTEIGDLFQKGNQNYDSGDYGAAIEYYSKVIQVNPQVADVWYNKGNAFYKLNMYKEALSAYQKAIDINPNFEDAIYNKKIILEKINCVNQIECSKSQKED